MLNKEEIFQRIDAMTPDQLVKIMKKAFDAAGIPYEMKPGMIKITDSSSKATTVITQPIREQTETSFSYRDDLDFSDSSSMFKDSKGTSDRILVMQISPIAA